MISSRFSVAIHIFSLIEMHAGKVTSEYIAGSVNTNPVVIRRIMSMLSKAKLIESRPGVHGIKLLRPIAEISFLDVFRAVELPEEHELFNVHQNTNIDCLAGRNIQSALEAPLKKLQSEMEQGLAQIKLDQIVTSIQTIN